MVTAGFSRTALSWVAIEDLKTCILWVEVYRKCSLWPITSDYFYVPGGALQRPQVEFLFALPLEVWPRYMCGLLGRLVKTLWEHHTVPTSITSTSIAYGSQQHPVLPVPSCSDRQAGYWEHKCPHLLQGFSGRRKERQKSFHGPAAGLPAFCRAWTSAQSQGWCSILATEGQSHCCLFRGCFVWSVFDLAR